MNIVHKEQTLTIPDNSIQSVGDLEVVGNGYADQSKTWNQIYAQNFATLDTRMEALSATSQAHTESFTALDSKVDSHAQSITRLLNRSPLPAHAPLLLRVDAGNSVPLPFRPSEVWYMGGAFTHSSSIQNQFPNNFPLDSVSGDEYFVKFFCRPHFIYLFFSGQQPETLTVKTDRYLFRRLGAHKRHIVFEGVYCEVPERHPSVSTQYYLSGSPHRLEIKGYREGTTLIVQHRNFHSPLLVPPYLFEVVERDDSFVLNPNTPLFGGQFLFLP